MKAIQVGVTSSSPKKDDMSSSWEFERAYFQNREICDDHSLQTMVITKPTAVSNRFLAVLYLSQSLPKLPPHLYKCGGN